MKNKLQIVWSSIAIISVCACSTPYTQPDAPIKEVPFTQVHLDDNFWSPRIETNRTVSIPSAFKECEKNGRFDNFAIAGGLMKGEHRGDFSFDDTDPYKIIEGASYSYTLSLHDALPRSEERRVGKECSTGTGWLSYYLCNQSMYPFIRLVGHAPLGKNQQPRTL